MGCHAAVPGARNLYVSANAQRHILAFARAYPQVEMTVVTQDARPSFRRECSGRSVRFLPLEELVNALMKPWNPMKRSTSKSSAPQRYRLISVSTDGWGSRCPQSVEEMAQELLPPDDTGELSYRFTGRTKPRLGQGDRLVFRFKGMLLGEGEFVRADTKGARM